MSVRLKRQVYLLIAALALSMPTAAQTDEQRLNLQITRVEIGLGGKYKVGCWTPVTVTLAAGRNDISGVLEIVVPDGDGVPTRFTAAGGQPVHVSAGEDASFLLYARFGRIHSDMEVNFRSNDNDPDSSQRRVHAKEQANVKYSTRRLPAAEPASRQLVVIVGGPIGIESAIRPWHRYDSERIIIAPIEDVSLLPDQWYGYEGVDTLVLATSQLERFERIENEQWSAINGWIQLGGRMILCAAASGERLLAEDGPVARFVPGAFQRTANQCETIGLESFAELPYRIDVPRDLDGQCLFDVAVITAGRGLVHVSERSGADTRPIIVHSSHGLGQIVFVAVDLDRPPLADWKGRDRVVSKMLEWTLGDRSHDKAQEHMGEVRHAGYDDLSGQLRGALDQFDQVKLVPFSLVASLVVVYLVLIGPADYFLLRKTNRMSWAWFTFPLLVVVFSALAYGLASYYKGSRLRINQVDLIDWDAATGVVRGTHWAQVYSPRTDTYDLSLVIPQSKGENGSAAGVPMGSRAILAWQGLPGSALGGMDATASGTANTASYSIHTPQQAQDVPLAGISGLSIQTWSTKNLTARWSDQLAIDSPSRLSVRYDGQLVGTVASPFDFELSDCYLYYAPWAFPLGKMPANEVVLIDDESRRRNLKWKLTRRSIGVGGDMRAPWNRYSRGVPRIVEMLMFHEAAGGRSFTGLLHRHQRFCDLSMHLRTGRAILVGRADQHRASVLTRDKVPIDSDDVSRWTYCRLILPVHPEKTSQEN